MHISVSIMTSNCLKREVKPVSKIICTQHSAQIIDNVLNNGDVIQPPLQIFSVSTQISTFLLCRKFLSLALPHEATVLFIFIWKVWIHNVQNFWTVYCCKSFMKQRHIYFAINILTPYTSMHAMFHHLQPCTFYMYQTPMWTTKTKNVHSVCKKQYIIVQTVFMKKCLCVWECSTHHSRWALP